MAVIPDRNQTGILSLLIQSNRYTCRHWAADGDTTAPGDTTAAGDLSLPHGKQKGPPAPPAELEETHFFPLPLHPAAMGCYGATLPRQSYGLNTLLDMEAVISLKLNSFPHSY